MYLKEREKREGNGTHVHEHVKGSEGRGRASQKWAGDGGTEKETNQNQVIMACMYKHVCLHETHYFIS